jgi:Pilus formation protein N terminal region
LIPSADFGGAPADAARVAIDGDHATMGGPINRRWDNVMIKQRSQGDRRRQNVQSVYAALSFAAFLLAAPESFANEVSPLTIEQPSKQPIVLTQGYSTTIHSERPFGKISITNPEIVDLVLRTDKSVVLIPQRLGRTNVDFLDDHGGVISSVDVVVVRQSTTDRVVVYDHPTLGAFSSYHCGSLGCEHFEEIPTKEQALSPGAPGDQALAPNMMPGDNGPAPVPGDNGLSPGMTGDNGQLIVPPPQ